MPPETNVWMGAQGWFGPSYPEAGDPSPAPGAPDRARPPTAPPTEPPTQAPAPPTGRTVPPRHGPGSSRADWLAYARAHDVTVPHDASRVAVIDACARAGVPT
jgi:hypothetical protein